MDFDELKKANLFIIGEPESLFSPEEIKLIKSYLEEGGNLLIIKGNKGSKEINDNLNSILSDYGISFKGDNLDNEKIIVNFEGNNFIGNDDKNKNNPLIFSYPNGQSLNIEIKNEKNSKISSLYTNDPIKKYIFAETISKSGKGKLCAFGSTLFFEDSNIHKEDISEFISKLIEYLLEKSNNSNNKEILLNLNSPNGNWKETGKMYSTLITKPKMTEKLLKKPPPKYIYDIIINTMKITEFPKGLFTELELEHNYFKSDAHHKLDFLQKAIDITKIVNNENFQIKCTNILKGVETEQTNYFLQMFYKAATTKKMSLERKNILIKKYLEKKQDKNIKLPKSSKEENEQIQLAIEKSKKEMELQLEMEKKEKNQIELALKESEKEYQLNKINNDNNIADDEEYDEFFGICPITQEYMNNPVLCPSGNYYEKNAIIEWIKKNNTDPLTREKLTVDMLVEDEEYKKK